MAAPVGRVRIPAPVPSAALEQYFEPFRANTVGHDQTFRSPYGEQRIVYADWTASGRLYGPIERRLVEEFGPFVGNTHSESSATGAAMTLAYHEAHRILKAHVHAGPRDLILTTGTGMTGGVNKFQRLLGLKVPDGLRPHVKLAEAERPVVFVTHMEHHSNHTSWYETIAEVVVVPPDARGVVDLAALDDLLHRYRDRPLKIGAFSACSNVTGITTPYHAMAKLMHRAGGVAFVDWAASAPYVALDMHPADAEEQLDAVLFSPHKFLGGPGSSGVLIFNRDLYHNRVPDDAGGGTVAWTNPWGKYAFLDDPEVAGGRRHAGVPAGDQGGAGRGAEGGDGGRGDGAPRGGDGAAGDGRAGGNPRRARAGAGAPRAAGDRLVLRRDRALQPDGAAAERPVRHPVARRLFLRGHLRALPPERGSLPGRSTSPTASTPAISRRSPAGCGCRSIPRRRRPIWTTASGRWRRSCATRKPGRRTTGTPPTPTSTSTGTATRSPRRA